MLHEELADYKFSGQAKTNRTDQIITSRHNAQCREHTIVRMMPRTNALLMSLEKSSRLVSGHLVNVCDDVDISEVELSSCCLFDQRAGARSRSPWESGNGSPSSTL